MNHEEAKHLTKRANEIAGQLGDVLEKADIENGVVLSILSSMLIDLAKDMGMPEADLIKIMVKLISIKYQDDEDEESPQTTTDEEGVTQWLN